MIYAVIFVSLVDLFRSAGVSSPISILDIVSSPVYIFAYYISRA